MAELYNSAAPKKAANLSINSDLLRKTWELNINLSTLKNTSRAPLAPSHISETRLLELWTWLSPAFNARHKRHEERASGDRREQI